MKKYSKIKYFLLFILIIFLTGFSIFSASQYFGDEIYTKRADLLRLHKSTGEISFAWQASIMPPSRSNFIKLRKELTKRGDCENILALDFLLEGNKSLEHYECLVESGIYVLEEDLKNMPTIKKIELINFQNLIRGEPSTTPGSPKTNSGKLHQMIVNSDFRLFAVETRIGNKISELQEGRTDLELRIAVSELFYQIGFYSITEKITDKLIAQNPCLEDVYLLQASAFYKNKNLSASLDSYQNLLNCNPINYEAIQRVIEIKGSNSPEAKILLERIRIIESIKTR